MTKQEMINDLKEVLGAEGVLQSLVRLGDTELVEKVYNVIAEELYKEEK